MALLTYADLKSAIADWLERSDLTHRIPDFIRLAEAQINRVLRERRMTRRATAVISDPLSATPSDLVEVRAISLSDGEATWELSPAPLELLAASSAAGRPRHWSLVGAELAYHPPPDRAYSAILTYVCRAPPLSEAANSNWLLAEYPDLYLFGALKEAGPYLRDAELAAIFEAKHRIVLEELRQAQRTQVGPLKLEPELTLPILRSGAVDGLIQ